MKRETLARLLMFGSRVMSSRIVSAILGLIMLYFVCYWAFVAVWYPVRFLIELF